MFEWLWRKGAPERQPYVPAWLTAEADVIGFARGIEGAHLLDRASGEMVIRRAGSWEAGIVRAKELQIDGQTLVRARQPAIAEPSGGAVIDAESRAAVASILSMLRAHGLIA